MKTVRFGRLFLLAALAGALATGALTGGVAKAEDVFLRAGARAPGNPITTSSPLPVKVVGTTNTVTISGAITAIPTGTQASTIYAAQPAGTPQPVSGYPVIGTCTRTIVYSANTSTTSGTLSAGRYVLTPSAQAWFHPVASATPVTTSNGMRIGDVPGAPVSFFVDGVTQDRIAIITSSGGGTFNVCAETY